MNEKEKRQLRNVFLFWFVVYLLLFLFVWWCATNPLQPSPYIAH